MESVLAPVLDLGGRGGRNFTVYGEFAAMTESVQPDLGTKNRLFGKVFKRYIMLSFAWAAFCILFGVLVLAPLARVDGLGLYPIMLLAVLPAMPTFIIFMLLGAVLNVASVVPEQFMDALGFGVLFLSFIIQGMTVSWIKGRRALRLKNEGGGS